jgi:transcriptional regulator with XRE-family HTH domain
MAKAKKAVSPRERTSKDAEIGVRIRAMRIDQGLSQDELGQRLGVSFQQVQKYEKGTNRISAGRLIQIANLLKTTPHELMGWGDGAAKVGDASFDNESYKLAKTFADLPEGLKSLFRNLIHNVIEASR